MSPAVPTIGHVTHNGTDHPKGSLPPLTGEQVVGLFDALLANADRLLGGGEVLLEAGHVALARAIGILGAEESGKAIALFNRRVQIAKEPEGSRFVTKGLQELWKSHAFKLKAVHQFLVDESYWFGDGPWYEKPGAEDVLRELDSWATGRNTAKQAGFYVDVDVATGEPVEPNQQADTEDVREVLARVHQIGWQLRLGEHIEAKRQLESSEGVPRLSAAEAESEVAEMRGLFAKASGPDGRQEPWSFDWDDYEKGLREGVQGEPLNNGEYLLRLPGSPFAGVGTKGYEAETRELRSLAASFYKPSKDPDPVTDSNS